VNWSADETIDVPAVLVTLTSTVPAASAGVTAVIDVEEFTVYDVAATEPNETPVTLLKFVPMTVIEVPPAVVPLAVPRPVTVGGNTGAV